MAGDSGVQMALNAGERHRICRSRAAIGALLGMLLITACTSRSNAPAEDTPVAVGLSAEDRERLVDEVDEIVESLPGGFAQLGEFRPEDSRIIQSRHVLRAATPVGPADLFELTIRTDGEPFQKCLATQYSDGLGLDCGPVDEPLPGPDSPMLYTALGGGEVALFVLAGPIGTEYFVVTTGNSKIAVTAVEGLAVMPAVGDLCELRPTSVEAWSHDRLLEAEGTRDDWCPQPRS